MFPSVEEIEQWIEKILKIDKDNYCILFNGIIQKYARIVLSCKNFGSQKCRFNIVKNPNACEKCPFFEKFEVDVEKRIF